MTESQQLLRQQLLESLHEIVFQKFDALLPDDVLFSCFCDIHDRVEQLRAIQRPATNQVLQYSKAAEKSSRQARLTKLLEWFKSHGGILNEKLAVAHIGPGAEDFGFITNGAVEADELLALIPPTLCVPSQSDHVQKSALAWLMKSKDIPPNMCLVFWLITQKLGVDSNQFMQPYVDSLPVRVRHVVYATPYSLRLLRDSFLCRKAILRYVSILRHYLILLNNVYSSRMKRNKAFVNNLTFDLFRWASAIVQTRANTHYQRRVSVSPAQQHQTATLGSLQRQSSSGSSGIQQSASGTAIQFAEDIALCPVLDLFNHESGMDKKEFDEESGCYKLSAFRSFQPDKEVTMHYSTLSNPERFVEQGFWPNANPDEDQTIVPVPLPAHFLKELDHSNQKCCSEDDGEAGGCHDAHCGDSSCADTRRESNGESAKTDKSLQDSKNQQQARPKDHEHHHHHHQHGKPRRENRRNNVLQAYKVIREHLGANPVSYGTVGVLYLGAQARPHDSAKRVATFLCLSPEHQTILLGPEYQSTDDAGSHNADYSSRFESMFASLCREYPNLDRDAFIFLHKSIDAHIRDIKLHGAEPLPGDPSLLLDEQRMTSSGGTYEDAEETSWKLSMNAFFERASECDMKFLERCLAHCKTVVRDLVKRSIEANRMRASTPTVGYITTNGSPESPAAQAQPEKSDAVTSDSEEAKHLKPLANNGQISMSTVDSMPLNGQNSIDADGDGLSVENGFDKKKRGLLTDSGSGDAASSP